MKSTLAIIAISAILLSGLAVLPGARMSNAYSLPTTSSHSPMTMNDINFVLNGPFQQVAVQSSPTG